MRRTRADREKPLSEKTATERRIDSEYYLSRQDSPVLWLADKISDFLRSLAS